ncbi:MAG: hypothetical protein ACKV2Q_05265 [Planctomycetaceae bacterium]
MTTSDVTTRNELAWLANCYVAGELSVDETAAFEIRLETDVAACSAVARAMELNLAVAAAFETLAAPCDLQPSVDPLVCSAAKQSARWTVAAITALVISAIAAASVALMIGSSGSTTNGAERLVAAWASGEAARNDTADDELFDATDDADLDPPDWMLAALTADDVNEQLPGNNDVREN